jgi:polar amino acid transport system substrate-binding protein
VKSALIAIGVALSLVLPVRAADRNLSVITIDIAPAAFADPATGKPRGALPSFIAELARRTGYGFALSLVPFSRVDVELESGERDCAVLVWLDYRARFAERGGTAYVIPSGAVARKGISLKSEDDLRSLTVSVLRGLPLDAVLSKNIPMTVEFDQDSITSVRKMERKRVDAIIGPIASIRFQANQEGLTDTLGDVVMLKSLPVALQCSKKSRNLDLMPSIGAMIHAMRDDGTLERIRIENNYPAAVPTGSSD